jgi:hypothetical protein
MSKKQFLKNTKLEISKSNRYEDSRYFTHEMLEHAVMEGASTIFDTYHDKFILASLDDCKLTRIGSLTLESIHDFGFIADRTQNDMMEMLKEVVTIGFDSNIALSLHRKLGTNKDTVLELSKFSWSNEHCLFDKKLTLGLYDSLKIHSIGMKVGGHSITVVANIVLPEPIS